MFKKKETIRMRLYKRRRIQGMRVNPENEEDRGLGIPDFSPGLDYGSPRGLARFTRASEGALVLEHHEGDVVEEARLN